MPYPIKGARFTIGTPFLDADGDPTDPVSPDTEISIDGAAYANCDEEVTTITGSNGSGYITLTGAEMDCSLAFVAAKVASGPKNTLATLYPRNLPSISTGTLSAGSAGGGTLGTILPYDITNCFIKTTGGTGGGGTGGANNQARRIVTYNTSTGAFTVTPNWETTPSTDTTYAILLPEGVTPAQVKGDLNYVLGVLQSNDLDTIAGIVSPLSTYVTQILHAVINGDVIQQTIGSTGNDATHVHLNEDGNYADDEFNDQAILLFDVSTGRYHSRWITDYVGATSLATLDRALPASPQNATDHVYLLNIRRNVNTVKVGGTDQTAGDLASLITTVDTVVDGIKTTTDAIGATGTGLSAIPWNASWDAEVQSEVADALGVYDPPTKAELDTAQAAIIDGVLDGIRLKKNTEQDFVFRLLSSTDHISPIEGMTVTATRSIDKGAFAACTNAVAEISDGWYGITLSADDTNGNVIALNFTATGADSVGVTVFTQPTD